MTRHTILLATLCTAAYAQPTVAPTPAAVGPVRGQDSNGYNIVQSFETGYRFHTVGGNETRYRSDVNFGNGIRLLGSSLRVNSKEGTGRLFDEIVLNTQGLGNDPYQSATLRVEHNRFYRYNFTWHVNEYVNPGLTTGTLGGHALDTRRQWQDHEIVLLPRSSFQIFAGYSRDSQTGTGVSSVQLFDARGDDYPLFGPIDRRQTEYRVGAKATVHGFQLNLMRGWQQFRERDPLALTAPSAGANPDDANTLASLARTEPYEGSSPYWRLFLYREKEDWFAVNGRFSYTGGRRNFLFDETAAGANRFGADLARQVVAAGSARRPVSDGTFTFSLFPTNRLTFTNHTGYHNTRIDGDSTYREINNATLGQTILQFQTLGIRTVVNESDLSYRLTSMVGLYGGYHYSTRRIRSTEGFAIASSGGRADSEQTNRIQSGIAGIRLTPKRPFSILLDAELGRADQPFFPISGRDYHALRARALYRTRTLQLSASARSNYNNNSSSLFVHSSRGRTYAFDASWSAGRWLSLDAGYSKLHLDTVSGIAYFASGTLVTGDRSVYLSNVHAANAGLRFLFGSRADLYLGYSRVQDTGDGRADPLSPRDNDAQDAASLPAFIAAQTFPLTYDSPQGRISIRLHNKVRWNLGYQFYHYREEFQSIRNYRAHTGFTSVLWSF